MAKKKAAVKKVSAPPKMKRAAAEKAGGKGTGRGVVLSTRETRKVTPPIEKGFYPDKWNNTEKLILARRSTRAYRKKPHTKLLEFLSPNNLHPIPSGAVQGVAEGRFDMFWGAPTVILLLKDKRGIGNPDLDIGITGTNMILAAHSMGLGTCWIGIASTLMFYKKWRETFNIRHPWYLEQGLLVGYPVGDPDGFVHRDTHYIDWFDDAGHKVVR